MSDFRFPRHQLVMQLLESLNGEYLSSVECYFGGGTRIVLELFEYRESLDIDFLCSSREGYRLLRNTITQQSLGEIFSGSYRLMRDVRADMYGIRTYLEYENQPIKFEIISEGRIELSGTRINHLPVDVLDHTTALAEKFLANTDRGRDPSTRSRDLIDLAYMSASWRAEPVQSGFEVASSVYGESVAGELQHALSMFEQVPYRTKCIKDLSVQNTRKLNRGIDILNSFIRT